MHTSTGVAGKKRLLSIDGGGLAGLIPAECLIAMQTQLNEITGTQLPLGKRFDLIGGTSTGAILAAGLCLGLSATQLRDFYLDYGAEIFTKVFWPLQFWHKYSTDPLTKYLKQKFGEQTKLGDSVLLTNLLVVSKNATQGATWFFTNNPRGKYFAINKDLPLWHVVRASTAARTYFPPQKIAVPDGSGKTIEYEFIDGGVSTFNNPAFQVFLEATEPTYNSGWDTGPDKLLMISLGTGYCPLSVAKGKASKYCVLDWVKYTVQDLLDDANLQQNLLMLLISERPAGVRSAMCEMNEAGVNDGSPGADTLKTVGARLGATKLLTYQRCTIGLTRKRLDDLGLTDIDPGKVREMDAVDQGQYAAHGASHRQGTGVHGAGTEFFCVGSAPVDCATAGWVSRTRRAAQVGDNARTCGRFGVA
jgi:Patatin-like phospholipase